MRIKTSTLLATAKAIYDALSTRVEGPLPFDRLPPNTKDLYGRMAKAAAEAIDRDYPLRPRAVIIPESRDSPFESTP